MLLWFLGGSTEPKAVQKKVLKSIGDEEMALAFSSLALGSADSRRLGKDEGPSPHSPQAIGSCQ